MIDARTVAHVARLARIHVSEADTAELVQRLDTILNLVDTLQAADTDGVEPLANPLDAVQRLRPDTVTEPDQRARLLALAPASEQGLFLVPRVIE